MSILKYVQSLDISHNPLDKQFPFDTDDLPALKCLNLADTCLCSFPTILLALPCLERVSLANNTLRSLPRELRKLTSLNFHDLLMLIRIVLCCNVNTVLEETLSMRSNQLSTRDIGSLDIPTLTSLDLSANNLDSLPLDILVLKGLIILSLAKNQLTQLPGELFVDMPDLRVLDLSDNKIEEIPSQIRRVQRLQSLSLANNPIHQASLRALCTLTTLTYLNMSNTLRSDANIPSELNMLTNLLDLNLSHNTISRIPSTLFQLHQLRRLNLSHNDIHSFDIPLDGQIWTNLYSFNLSSNQLVSLPSSIGQLVNLRRLLVNNNKLIATGIPKTICHLVNLTMLSFNGNELQSIPTYLCQCSQLQSLCLEYNCLCSLPPDIYMFSELQHLRIKGNPGLVMPLRPNLTDRSAHAYFEDFPRSDDREEAIWESRVLHVSTYKTFTPQRVGSKKKGDSGILQGLKQQTQHTLDIDRYSMTKCSTDGSGWKKGKVIRTALTYDDLFDEEVGLESGVICWSIVNFKPVRSDQTLAEGFYDGDSYVILHTSEYVIGVMEYQVYLWIGGKSPIDKMGCSAMYAVNLRNHLGGDSSIIREEEGEESIGFLNMLPYPIVYRKGQGSESSFYTPTTFAYSPGLYLLFTATGQRVQCELCELHWKSLSHSNIYMIDGGEIIYIWYGRDSKAVEQRKARLFAEVVIGSDRNIKSLLVEIIDGCEPDAFWTLLKGPPTAPLVDYHSRDINVQRHVMKIYAIGVISGHIDLQQVDLTNGELDWALIMDDRIHIIDCYSELFVWPSNHINKLLVAATNRMVEVIMMISPRPSHTRVTMVTKYCEPVIFKSKFKNWDSIGANDFTTLTAIDPINDRKTKWPAYKSNTMIDIKALFCWRKLIVDESYSIREMKAYNEELERMDVFRVTNEGLVRLKEDEIGQFFSGECYIIMCIYWKGIDNDESLKEEEEKECILYFWTGCDAPITTWPRFTLTAHREMQEIIGREYKMDVAVYIIFQQREPDRFLAHFRQKIVIHKSKKRIGFSDKVRMYQMRSTTTITTLRTVEVPALSSSLDSNYCSIVTIPYTDSRPSMMYVWVGRYSPQGDCARAQALCSHIQAEDCEIHLTPEGSEPPLFWSSLGGYSPYQQQETTNHNGRRILPRLFRCSAREGFFKVTEISQDFCQQDLDISSVMLLDNNHDLYVWIGQETSDGVRRLAVKAAKSYILDHTDRMSSESIRIIQSSYEPGDFHHCFHGWWPWQTTKNKT